MIKTQLPSHISPGLAGIGLIMSVIGLTLLPWKLERPAAVEPEGDINPYLVEVLEKSEMPPVLENKDGRCAKVIVLMYHHIEDRPTAIKNGYHKLSVSPESFRVHLRQLKEEGYTFIEPVQLIQFFDFGTPLPAKAAMITLDDAYEDNYRSAWPILKEFGAKAVIFTPTGLTANPDYLSWKNIEEMSSGGQVYFGNHTWSHHSSSGSKAVQLKEIGTADKDLNKHGQNRDKVFAYPYGQPSDTAEEVLKDLGYKIGFTTKPGDRMCAENRLTLPRIRAGEAKLTLP